MELAMRGNAIAETKTFALSMVRVLQVTWSTKPQSQQQPGTQRLTLEWQSTNLKQDTTTTNSLSETESIRTAQYFQNTSGTWKTATPTIKSIGASSRGQMHTGETLPAATCVCLRNSASCPLVTFPSSTRNLSWSLSVVMRTSSSQQPIRTGAVPTVLKFEILTL